MTKTYNGLTYAELLEPTREFHYGDQSIVRESSIAKAIGWNEMAKEFALTTSHPAMQHLEHALAGLTEVEHKLFTERTGGRFNPYA